MILKCGQIWNPLVSRHCKPLLGHLHWLEQGKKPAMALGRGVWQTPRRWGHSLCRFVKYVMEAITTQVKSSVHRDEGKILVLVLGRFNCEHLYLTIERIIFKGPLWTFSILLLEAEEESGWYESWRITFHYHFSEESSMARLLLCITHSLIKIVFVTSWPKAKLADVITAEKN